MTFWDSFQNRFATFCARVNQGTARHSGAPDPTGVYYMHVASRAVMVSYLNQP